MISFAPSAEFADTKVLNVVMWSTAPSAEFSDTKVLNVVMRSTAACIFFGNPHAYADRLTL